MRSALSIVVGSALVLPIAAQDALTTVPESYRQQFENDWAGAPTAITLTPGQERWVGAGQRQRLKNRGETSAEFLRFDLRTPPRGKSVDSNSVGVR